MRKFFLGIIATLAIGGCTAHLSPAGRFDALAPAMVCILAEDTVNLLIRDFFPNFAKIDSVASRGVEIHNISHSGADTVQIVLKKTTPLFSVLEIWSEGNKGSIILRNGCIPPAQEPLKNALQLTTKALGRDHSRFVVETEGSAATYFVLWQNSLLDARFIRYLDKGRFEVIVPDLAKNFERSYIRVFAYNNDGISNDLLIPLAYGKPITQASELKRSDKHAQIMYSLMIDRFYNGNASNDFKINSPEVLPKVDYWGGDLAGINQKLKEGFFDTLGVNTIWISPITQNPYDAWGQNLDPKTKFSGYHGYWPIYATKLDPRYGSETELKEFLANAHADQKNVLLDYVAHHMHVNSPTLQAHPDWTTPSITPDGRPNFELWDEFRLTTWFDKHIPSLDLGKPEISAPLTDSALYWLRQYDFDGFRHDATKHIPELFWRMLTQKIVKEFPDRNVYQIGETYGKPQLIGSYVRNGIMDGQFDFNMYDTFIWTLLEPDGSFENVARVLKESLENYGYHNLMGYITGNHDRPRFISMAGGALDPHEDAKKAGWKRDIGVGDPRAYDKLALLETFIMTIPGVPCIYYGDEYGQPGANDPDNRRWMKFDNYSPQEQVLLQKVKDLTKLRSQSMPLIYGDLFPILAEKDVLVYLRVYMGDFVLVALNKSDQALEREVRLPFGRNKEQTVKLHLAPTSYKILTNNDL